ncbi:MAG: TlpA disulfide reductase family protein, partial [Thalassolituus sp.]
ASWCTPCRKSLPMLNELRNELKSDGFEVLAINVDETKEEARAFLKEVPVDYPTLFDDADTAATYELRGMPTAYLIDAQGNLHSQHVGFNPKDMPAIREEVRRLLSKSE